MFRVSRREEVYDLERVGGVGTRVESGTDLT